MSEEAKILERTFDIRIGLDEDLKRFFPRSGLSIINDIFDYNTSSPLDFLDLSLAELIQVFEIHLWNILPECQLLVTKRERNVVQPGPLSRLFG